MVMKSVDDFLDSALVVWAKSILNLSTNEIETTISNNYNYELFANGEYFYQILKQVDPRLQCLCLPNEGEPFETTRSRLLNLDFILRNIRYFYHDILNQILLVKLPDIYQIAKYPDTEESFKEMEKILLLLLGIAIKGEYKETFIEQIQLNLDTQTQLELVPYLKLVNDDMNFSIYKTIKFELDYNDNSTQSNKQQQQQQHHQSITNTTTHTTSNNNIKTTLTLEVNSSTNLTTSSSAVSSLYSNNQDDDLTNNKTLNLNSSSSNPAASTTTQLNQQLTQSFINSNNNNNNNPNSNNSQVNILKYSNIDDLNYFLNNKLLANLQRVVDERDDYLESVVELLQDKDYLNCKLNNNLDYLNLVSMNTNMTSINNTNSNSNLNSAAAAAAGASNTQLLDTNNLTNSDKLYQLQNSKSSNSILLSSCSSLDHHLSASNKLNLNNSKSSLINLSDSQTLFMLFESIYKELNVNKSILNNMNDVVSNVDNNNKENDRVANELDCQDSREPFESDSIESTLIHNSNKDYKNTTNHHHHHHSHNHHQHHHHNGTINASNLTSTSSMKSDNENFLLNEFKNRKFLANNWNQKIAIELVECKIKLKQLINEIEEKCEQIESLKDEIDDVKKQVNKLRNENVDLQQKAALTNVYADELESLREKSSKVDKYESELAKLKEKIEELQASKSRLEELKEENLILSETRSFMEKQINDYQIKLLSAQRTDSDLNKYKNEIDDLLKQRDLDNKRFVDLLEKNMKLELDMKNVLNTNVNLDKEINSYKQELTFLTAELTKQQQLLESNHLTAQTQTTQLIEASKFKQSELEHLNNELNQQLKSRDQDLSRLKENLRLKEANLDECMIKLKVLNEELGLEHESRLKAEKNLEQHKCEIKDLQVRLDDCVNETKKLDMSIRAAAETNEQKETETKENLKKLLDSHEQLNQSYKKLLIDHEHLQKIYLQLESDYEDLYSELTKKHSTINNLQIDLEESKDKLRENEKILDKYTSRILIDRESNTEHELETINESDESSIAKEEFYQTKFEELNQEIYELKQKRELVEKKVNDLSQALQSIQDENGSLKTENTSLKVEFTKQKEKFSLQQMQMSQLNDKLKVFENLNEKLEDEKSQLFEQLHMLLQQNQEILVQTLNSKDMYHEETKAYLQQLNNLKRQKEMLEQKIMEQYKSCPSLSQKQRSKKSINNTNTTPGLMDMVSTKTRQFVQKVRNKSSTTSNTNTNNSNPINQISTNENLILNVNDLSEDTDSVMISEQNTYCHKYSADDINYLSIKPKDSNLPKSTNNLVNCLSSSSTTSSSASSTISNYEPSSNSSNNQCLNKLANDPKTPIKLDPKTLKLGGRPQSICSSTCSSPVPQTQSITSSPNVVTIKPPSSTTSQNSLNDFKRVLITSSPKFNQQPFINTINQSPSSSSTSSCSSSSSTSTSSASLAGKSTILTTSTPQKIVPNQITKSPIAVITKKPNSNSIQLISSSSINGRSKSQKITSKIADSLQKFRLSADIDKNYDQIETCRIEDEDDEDDDDFSDSEEEFNSKQDKNLLNKNKTLKTSNGLSQTNSSSANSASNNKNEIWLEYGCI